MNKKEQNSILVELKKENTDTIYALDSIWVDAMKALNYELDDDIAGDWVHAYLNGEISLKQLRKRIESDKEQCEENKKFG